MADSSTSIDYTQFQVDLQQLGSTVDSVSALSAQVQETLANIYANLKNVESAWNTPSSASFVLVVDWYWGCQSQLAALLDQIATRLKMAYENYLDVEQTNTTNAS
jgi:uncharacterized protein YukE